MSSPFLYEDMLMEIFLRLPAKSVGKFRCLSKTWRTNLSTSGFINLHLTTRKGKQPNLFLKKFHASFFVATLPVKDDTVSRKIELPTSTYMVVDSCNGLVLLSDLSNNLSLVNPITSQHVQVPFAPLNSDTLSSYMCGFGYDNYSDDYKIVNLSGLDIGTITQVYSLKSKGWKTVNTSPQHPITNASFKGVFTNGAIHWVSYSRNRPSRIIAFNLTDEVFYDIPSPASARDWDCPFDRVFVLEGCLCVIDYSGSLKKDLWIMKEYGVEASWTKFTVGSCSIYKPLCIAGNEEIVLLTYKGGRVIVYNLVEGAATDIDVDGYTTFWVDGVAFFDSLVSLPSDQHVFF